VTKDAEFSLGEIADRLAIQHVIARYVHAIDSHDIETLDDVFLPDAEFDLTSAGGLKSSWPDIKVFFQTGHQERFAIDFHLFSNTKIDFDENRTGAVSSTKVFNPRRVAAHDTAEYQEFAVGVYRDTWRKVGDGWRIAQRVWTRTLVGHA
jgi:hypothetical protein